MTCHFKIKKELYKFLFKTRPYNVLQMTVFRSQHLRVKKQKQKCNPIFLKETLPTFIIIIDLAISWSAS